TSPPPSQIMAAAAQSAPVIIEPDPIPDDLPTDPGERLTLAQAARERGDLNESLRIYESLVFSGAHLKTIINDIEQAAETHPTNARLFQVLGDAMMRDGRLQRALEAYRKAMSTLKT
ncbi:MAG: tetratricopeptide repeat protein, partial [Anaerolineae bacterium]|nr:tetratricopeptide repeat protein [Anaerolineae bacterium]